jgi:hypothetical protein
LRLPAAAMLWKEFSSAAAAAEMAIRSILPQGVALGTALASMCAVYGACCRMLSDGMHDHLHLLTADVACSEGGSDAGMSRYLPPFATLR